MKKYFQKKAFRVLDLELSSTVEECMTTNPAKNPVMSIETLNALVAAQLALEAATTKVREEAGLGGRFGEVSRVLDVYGSVDESWEVKDLMLEAVWRDAMDTITGAVYAKRDDADCCISATRKGFTLLVSTAKGENEWRGEVNNGNTGPVFTNVEAIEAAALFFIEG